ncbi:MAG: hypothetical protein WAL25_09315 [Acidimicrobiia bacterium]
MKSLGALVAGALIVVSCSGTDAVSANVMSTGGTVGTGQQRVLIELLDADREAMALTDPPIATLRDENGSPLGSYVGEPVWLVPGEAPAFAFWVEIPAADTYQVTVGTGDRGETRPVGLVAVDDTSQIDVGDPAPPIGGNPMIGPALVVFASPKWCPSRSCQPMIDQVEAASSAEGLEWFHVEVFANPEASSEDDLVLSNDVETWGLPSQPWAYVVDAGGAVSAVFEGAVSDEELADAIDRVDG